MEMNAYVDRIENSVEDPVALESLRQEISADETLSPDDREFLDERIGTYLADLERASGDLEPDGSDTEIG